MVKIACHSANFPEINIHELIRELSLYGYDGIEINATTLPYADPHISVDANKEEINKVKRTLSENNLSVSALCAHTNLTNPVEQQKAIDFTKECIILAKELGTDIVQGSSGVVPNAVSEDEAWAVLSENVNEIVSFAEKNQVKFTFEPVVVMLVNNRYSFQKIKSTVTEGNLYLNFDPSQLVVVGDDIPSFIHEFKNDIVHAHIKDGEGTPDSFKFPPLGSGEVNFEKMVQALNQIKFEGFYSVEYEAHVFGYEKEINEVCKGSLEFIKKYYKEDYT